MKYYCDTSILASIYLEDSHSKKAMQWLQNAVLPIPLSLFSELELMSAIQQRLFRKEITQTEVLKCHYYFQKNLNQGVYKRVTLEGKEYSQALQLVRNYTSSIGCRTLDVLHVASALLLNIQEFVTCDVRQKLLAETAGLRVISF
ncbi:MAG: type II toxin-antitoxin system VapC family toxin [Verrucomicrobiae bacterium]|nr:type II toxin-antitoxin system VapC family toxin [Verrucomicrobiae bacterium]